MLSGKCAVVTGSTSGIGLGIARALAQHGANVMLNGFGEAGAIDELIAELRAAHGVKVVYSAADMGKPIEIQAMIAQAEEMFGSVDILVNNAGIQYRLSGGAVSDRKMGRDHRDQPLLRVPHDSCISGRDEAPRLGTHRERCVGAWVGGLAVQVRLYRREARSRRSDQDGRARAARVGITCNAICPGYVLTPLVEKQIDDQAKAHNMAREEVIERVILERQPSRDFVKIEEISALAVLLCGDGAASITGAALSIDGGWVAQ